MRGTPLNGPHVGAERGIIPACAGNTAPEAKASRASRDHPRVRGEHGLIACPALAVFGSSPRARGTPIPYIRLLAATGIIPACAGNTPRDCRPNRPPWDHPRVRGEHNWPLQLRYAPKGSSPRARGTLDSVEFVARRDRIIPACAGNTPAEFVPPDVAWDHPRVRGEHMANVNNLFRNSGSSPRARGTLRPMRRAWQWVGIIPACAGNTRAAYMEFASSRDHPRVRGEHDGSEWGGTPLKGSSPRARGTRSHRPPRAARGGIIPACAGNTLRPAAALLGARDHPRVRGEHVSSNDLRPCIPGSSPRARGTLLKIPVQNTIATELRLLFNEFAK